MMDRDEYAVRLLDLPHGVGGFISESPDGYTNIYINARHGHNGQRRAFGHELRHAENDDLHSAEDLETIEARADGVDPRLKAIPKLLRARDLLPHSLPLQGKVAPARPVTKEVVPLPASPRLTAYQARVLAGCLSELDRWYFREAPVAW